MFNRFFLLLSLILFAFNAQGFDDEEDMTVDRADSHDMNEFHEKDDSIVIWNDEGEGVLNGSSGKAISTYDEEGATEQNTTSNTATNTQKSPIQEETIGATPNTAPQYTKPQSAVSRQFESGQAIKVRAEYKLSMDPGLGDVATLFDAVGGLHLQLNNYCPNGWKKEEEWHLPTQRGNTYYLHYAVKCK